jgi:hypothetical protein
MLWNIPGIARADHILCDASDAITGTAETASERLQLSSVRGAIFLFTAAHHNP